MPESSLEQRLKQITKKGETAAQGSGSNFADKENLATYTMVQIGNAEIRHAVHFSYLRPLQYLKSEDAIFCSGNGQEFVIYGTNMMLLFDMLCGCNVLKVIEGQTIEIGDNEIVVERVLMPDPEPEE